MRENNIWALFVHPNYAEQGVGKHLHKLMLDWYFSQTETTVWLGTSPHTRAALFYAKNGWENVGMVNKGEIKFEMSIKNFSETLKLR